MATAKSSNGSESDNVSAEEIEANIRRIREDIAALAGTLKRYGAGKSDEYRARAAAAGDELHQKADEALSSLNEELGELEKELAVRVRRNPLQALGVAAGIGFLVALLVNRR
ncbi:ElaB/YqjD/DUF883 family membrane-anchored ribosome-binding protein [Roseibium hamelinense]|uniref:ElaB/YqjD/DUF883 family membrane-anchored ribosome-binding protein n=1 Tax=Roseibium hamelinense TaxID=150831 RepID=A0A562T9P8_9HYPH|nr:DUF883 family protein [Roseibium hamelinense]MTI45245.1 DUF883 family protein [Roseibium hamelinense]TWI90391.1 ElaB/YqjD/DUF883 family membrane-anchored ribosome-binding protein [Roseibium hamelinense]